MGSNFMKWFGENCVACPVRTIHRCFRFQSLIWRVPSTSSVLLHIKDLFLDPPLELAKKLAQLGAGVHGDVTAASFLVQSVYLVAWLCFVPMQKWWQVDYRTKVFLSRFWCFSGSWNLLRPKAEFTKQMLSRISVCDIGNTQQPPKAHCHRTTPSSTWRSTTAQGRVQKRFRVCTWRDAQPAWTRLA